jgi:hypothetical protein
VVDLRNLYAPEKMAAANFEYVSIGRPAARPGTALASPAPAERRATRPFASARETPA